MGFSLTGVTFVDLGRPLWPASSRAIGIIRQLPAGVRLRLGVSINRRLVRPRGPDTPHRVSAPPATLAFKRAGFRAMGSPCGATEPLGPIAIRAVEARTRLTGVVRVADGRDSAPPVSSTRKIQRVGTMSNENATRAAYHSGRIALARAGPRASVGRRDGKARGGGASFFRGRTEF